MKQFLRATADFLMLSAATLIFFASAAMLFCAHFGDDVEIYDNEQ